MFAIVVAHALTDTTPTSAASRAFDDFVTSDTLDASAELQRSQRFPGTRVVRGSRSWIRSVRGEEGDLTVMLVENQVTDGLLVQGRPFEYWARVFMKVSVIDDEWRVTDYSVSLVSETSDFSQPVWENTMDSGRDWRRFRNE